MKRAGGTRRGGRERGTWDDADKQLQRSLECKRHSQIRRYLRTNSGCVSWDTTTHAPPRVACRTRSAGDARGDARRAARRPARRGARAV
jgi:hypothetical protein